MSDRNMTFQRRKGAEEIGKTLVRRFFILSEFLLTLYNIFREANELK